MRTSAARPQSGSTKTERLLATKTVGTTTQDHLRLVKWAGEADGERLWAIKDGRHLTRRLERDLMAPASRWSEYRRS